RGQTEMRGFRPGKVPLGLVKRMHGRAIAYGIAEQKVQELYEKEVLQKNEFEVLGQPTVTDLDYEMDGDLHAVIRFGVRPEVELQDLSGQKLSRLKKDVTEEDVDEQIERIRLGNAKLVPLGEGDKIDDTAHVVIDLQRIDEASNSPIIGEKEEGVEFFMDDERLHDELREGLLGKKVGDAFRMDLPHGDHTHRYEVLIKEAKRRELPELDDAFAKEVTKERFETLEELRQDVRNSLEQAWERRSRELLEGQIVERLLELHPIPVPDSAIDVYLDSFVQDVRQRNDGSLPQGFDVQAFREANRGEAERQARWMLIRDAVIEKEGLEVTEEELDAYFEEAGADNDQISPDLLRRYYEQMNMLDRVKQQLLSRKVFDHLIERFEIEDKDLEDYDEEARAAQEAGSPIAQSEPLITPAD